MSAMLNRLLDPARLAECRRHDASASPALSASDAALAKRVRELLRYDEMTGIFTWRVDRGGGNVPGKVAGCDANGYRQIYVDGRKYRAHHLAWLYVYGRLPRPMIDHINGNRADNRIANLRLADRTINTQNLRRARKDSTTGLLGVCRDRSSFRAEIQANGQRHNLGSFGDPESAHKAYVEAKRRLHQGGTL